MKKNYEFSVTNLEGLVHIIYFEKKDLNFVYHKSHRILEIMGVSHRMSNLYESEFPNASKICDFINRAFKERIKNGNLKVFVCDDEDMKEII